MSERLYYTDSFLTTFTGEIADVREVSPANGEPSWKLLLNRTAFYPTSGGQPFDTGVLSVCLSGGASRDILVEQVEEDEEGKVWHFVADPIAAGTQVSGRIDWNRRFDHMQQHTGQHLLSAVLMRELHLQTVSFHLGNSISTIDLAGGLLAHHSLERVERIANEIVADDLAVTTKCVPRDTAEAMLAAGELRKLPERQGTIRLIEIADYDLNACGGTHVRSTGQIGSLLLRGVEKVSRGVRLEFVCGLRAVRTARVDAAILTRTAGLLSIGAPDLPDAVERLLTDAKASARERQKLRLQLAALEGPALVKEVPIENGLRLVVRGWKDRDSEYVKLLAARAVGAAQLTAAVFSAEEGDPVRVFLARSSDLNFNCGQVLREALAQLGLRGGGSADLAQGEFPAKQQQALVALVIRALQSAVALPH
jgi:alanyl-tRNA synthetase